MKIFLPSLCVALIGLCFPLDSALAASSKRLELVACFVALEEAGNFHRGEEVSSEGLAFAEVGAGDRVLRLGRGTEGTAYRVFPKASSKAPWILKVFDNENPARSGEDTSFFRIEFVKGIDIFYELGGYPELSEGDLRIAMVEKDFEVGKSLGFRMGNSEGYPLLEDDKPSYFAKFDKKTVGDIAKHYNTAIDAFVDKLEARGWIVANEDPEDLKGHELKQYALKKKGVGGFTLQPQNVLLNLSDLRFTLFDLD